MAQKKKKTRKSDLLGKLEKGAIILFTLLFLTWTYNKCQSSQAKYQVDPVVDDTEQVEPVETPSQVENTPPPNTNTTTTNTSPSPSLPMYATIYVAVDSLKLRKGPSLDSVVIARLKLNEPISYLNKKTNFRQKITLSNVLHNEPWIKVRNRRGQQGWVYGGGVRFYKQ